MYKSKTLQQSVYIRWTHNSTYDTLYVGTILCRMGGVIHNMDPYIKSQKGFLNENKGWNPQKQTKLDGDVTTILSTIPTSCAILPFMFCVSGVHRRVGSPGCAVHVHVYGD